MSLHYIRRRPRRGFGTAAGRCHTDAAGDAMVESEKDEPQESPDSELADSPVSLRGPEVIAVLAHELRNPLAPIRNGAELLRTLCSDPRQTQVVDMMSRQIVHLTRLLDDLLETARLRRGLVTLHRQSIDVGSIIQDALDAIRPAIDARRQNLLVSLPANPVRMHCDSTRLVQVLQNLLDNANRFTTEGGTLWLKAEVAGDELIFEVSDDGEGIDAQLLPRLFNVFAQGEQPLHRPLGGLGVGLAICRNVVEMHGGTISAHSEGRGRGSHFTVRLPIEHPIDEPTKSAANAGSIEGLRALVVDDNELIAMSLGQYLEYQGYRVTTAFSGEAALSAVDEFQPHVAVLDIGLPGIDGFEVARRLKVRFPSVVLIAVSGYSWDMLRDPDATLFSRYLAKPASPERIAAVIEAELQNSGQACIPYNPP
jgi:CheY-like chemotaxis protein/nitrogen-specific signal transduction histidine kinase